MPVQSICAMAQSRCIRVGSKKLCVSRNRPHASALERSASRTQRSACGSAWQRSVARRTTDVLARASMRISRLCTGGSIARHRTTTRSLLRLLSPPPPSPLPPPPQVVESCSSGTSSINSGPSAAAAAARTARRGRSITNTDSAPSNSTSHRLSPATCARATAAPPCATSDVAWDPSASPGAPCPCAGAVGAADEVQSRQSGSNTAAWYARLKARSSTPGKTVEAGAGAGAGRMKLAKARRKRVSVTECEAPAASENSAVTASAVGSGRRGVTRSTALGDVGSPAVSTGTSLVP
mmetsp:Transcript_14105/g.34131  ORF Transcript_14105/g.34131 Transcript_14105/m.34131 type:complete len:294 (-) Transcript_14105:193-1074(-)